MSSTSGSLLIPLRAPAAKKRQTDALKFQIEQVNAQRGSFRNITEQSLEQEVQLHKDSDEGDAEGEEDDSDDEERETRLQKVWRTREEMIRQVDQARNQAAIALDFISYLLTTYNQQHGELTMSPALKQAVPSKSLAVDVNEPPKQSSREMRDIDQVSSGWKARNFNAAADKFLDSASRLEEEAQKENVYWEQVIRVKNKGWAVCRLPSESHTLGVRFGFPEAGPAFRDRGLAALRRGGSGELQLDRGLAASEPKAMRVRVMRGEQILGTSALLASATTNEVSVEQDILAARDSLFEEELFHELRREARITASQGVESRQSAIHLPIHDDRQVVIDLVDPEDDYPVTSEGESSILADAIAIALRIILLHAHKQHLQKRSQPPRPVSDRPRPNPECSLLRPVLTFLRQMTEVQTVNTFLETLAPALQTADLRFTFSRDHLKTLNLQSTISNPPDSNSSSLSDLVLSALTTTPLESTFTLTLPSSKTTTIKIRTLALHSSPTSPSLPKTEYTVLPATYPNTSSSPITTPPPHLHSLRDLTAYILHLLALDIVSLIPSFSAPVKPERDTPTWEIWHFPSAELRLSEEGSRTKSMVVEVLADKIRLRYAWMNGEIGAAADDNAYYWGNNGKFWRETVEGGVVEDAKKKGLREVVRMAMG